MTTNLSKSNNSYAFEIRFVDDNIVQVFDIAAKRQQGLEATCLPTEYKQEEVLRGQLRYSKLVGSTPSTNFGIEDDGQPYQHHVTTKKSNNRRSIQRHTFFMMGGGGGGGGGSSYDYDYDYEEPQNLTTTANQINNNAKKAHHKSIVVQTSSQPPSPTPSIRLSPTSPTITTPPPLSPQQSSLPQRPLSPQQPSSPKPKPQQLQQPVAAMLSHGKHVSNTRMYYNNNNQNNNTSNISMNEISPIIPAATRQQQPTISMQPQQFYTEDYTSMTIIYSNDYDSKRNIHQQQEEQENRREKAAEKRGCCCIIS